MKLQTRITLWIVLTSLTLLAGAGLFQYWRTQRILRHTGEENLALVEEHELQNATDLNRVIQFEISKALDKADMDIFTEMIKLKEDVQSFQEISLFNEQGVVTYSSDRAALKQVLAPELKTGLLLQSKPLTRLAGDAIEVYQPIVARKSCTECHEFKEGAVAGVTRLRLSNATLAALKAQTQHGTEELQRNCAANLAYASVGAALIALGAAFWLSNSIARPIRHVAHQLADGAHCTFEAASQVGASSQALAEGASEQAASLEETSASLEEIAAMTRRNADHASSSKTLSQQARDSATAGVECVSDMGRTLVMVKGAVHEMETAVREMQTSSQEIAKIIKTIDEIAFQTNLLALNAAVEAARAGEAGAGFAVVADEVRSLAQRSAQAARDTSEKIAAAVKRSAAGEHASQRVVQSLGEIEASAGNIGKVFDGITDRVKSLDQVMLEISSASTEQSQGVSEVNQAVSQMDKVTQSSAAHAEENAAAAAELNAQAEAMKESAAELLRLVSRDNALEVHDSPNLARPKSSPPAVHPEVQTMHLNASSQPALAAKGRQFDKPGFKANATLAGDAANLQLEGALKER